MRKITSEKEKKDLARIFLCALEGAVRDFDLSVKAFLDSGDPSQAEKVLAVSEEIMRGLITIEVLLGLRPGEVEMAPKDRLLVKLPDEIAQQ